MWYRVFPQLARTAMFGPRQPGGGYFGALGGPAGAAGGAPPQPAPAGFGTPGGWHRGVPGVQGPPQQPPGFGVPGGGGQGGGGQGGGGQGAGGGGPDIPITEMSRGHAQRALARAAAMILLTTTAAALWKGYAWVQGYRLVRRTKREPDPKKVEEVGPQEAEDVILMPGPVMEIPKGLARFAQGYERGGVTGGLSRAGYNWLAGIPHIAASLVRNRDWKGDVIIPPKDADNLPARRKHVGKFLLRNIVPLLEQTESLADPEVDGLAKVLRLLAMSKYDRAPMRQWYEAKLLDAAAKARGRALANAQDDPAGTDHYFREEARRFLEREQAWSDRIARYEAKLADVETAHGIEKVLWNLVPEAGTLPLYPTTPRHEEPKPTLHRGTASKMLMHLTEPDAKPLSRRDFSPWRSVPESIGRFRKRQLDSMKRQLFATKYWEQAAAKHSFADASAMIIEAAGRAGESKESTKQRIKRLAMAYLAMGDPAAEVEGED